jgi:hypothetical protein
MDFSTALFVFFSGVLAHAIGIRLFKTWNKALLYKLTFINCLAILRFSENMSKELLKTSEIKDEQNIDIVFDSWRKVTMMSLHGALEDKVWRNIALADWDRAMRMLSSLEKGVEE